jgi:hypothetical protein
MIRIAISQAAFDAIALTLPLGSIAYEQEPDDNGEREIWLAADVGQTPPLPAGTREELLRRDPQDDFRGGLVLLTKPSRHLRVSP